MSSDSLLVLCSSGCPLLYLGHIVNSGVSSVQGKGLLGVGSSF